MTLLVQDSQSSGVTAYLSPCRLASLSPVGHSWHWGHPSPLRQEGSSA